MNTKKLVLIALTVTLLGSGTAFAQGKSESRGHGANDNGNNGRGAIASELKWRNAAHASAQAFLNANHDSAVGKLAALVNSTNDLNDGYFDELGEYYDEFGNPPRDSDDILADIEAADGAEPATTDLEFELAEALLYEEAKAAYEETVDFDDLNAPVEAAALVVGIADLSPEAVDALWDLLEFK